MEDAKYLGVTINNQLNWKAHISQITKKANNSRAFLQRNLHQCPRETKILCYKTLVRPQLEYASTVWDPPTSTLRDKLEMVQRRSARFVNNDYRRTSSVNTMLKNLQWQTLHQRRAHNKVITIYRILNKLTAIPSDLLIKTNTISRAHSLSLQIPHTRTDIYKSSFFPSAIRLWNKLTENVVTADTLDSFKSRAHQIVLVK